LIKTTEKLEFEITKNKKHLKITRETHRAVVQSAADINEYSTVQNGY